MGVTARPNPGGIKIRPAKIPRDLPAIAVLERTAFPSMSRVFFPLDMSLPDREEQERLLLKDEERWHQAGTARLWQEGCPVVVAEDTETRRVVGVAQWEPPEGDDRWEMEGAGLEELDTEPPASMDIKTYNKYTDSIHESEDKALDRVGVDLDDCWYLLIIATAPDQRRRGIGKMLMQWGLNQAKADRKTVFLSATHEGKFLYESVGFKVLDEFKAGDEPHNVLILFADGDEQ